MTQYMTHMGRAGWLTPYHAGLPTYHASIQLGVLVDSSSLNHVLYDIVSAKAVTGEPITDFHLSRCFFFYLGRVVFQAGETIGCSKRLVIHN